MTTATPAPRKDPAEIVLQTAVGYMPAVALNAAARLRIADLLKDGPRPVRELAAGSGANEDALYRLLRALASAGIFEERPGRQFANNAASESLRADADNSLRDMVLWIADAFHYRIYAEFMHSVMTGETCAERVTKIPLFDYFGQDKAEGEVFNNAMTTFSAQVIPAVLETYDFSSIGTLVDVAGGHGFVLTSVLQKYPSMRGVLVDMEHVVPGARERVQSLGLAGRCRVEAGDFFKSVPAGGDAFIMKHIIHDWDDDKALTILRNCHKALDGKKNGKVILLESVLPGLNEPHFAKFLDLEMLTLPGGRERTEEEYRALFEKAGFRLTRIVPNRSPLWTIEAERV